MVTSLFYYFDLESHYAPHQSGTMILRIETGRGNFLDHMASIVTASPNIHVYSNDSS